MDDKNKASVSDTVDIENNVKQKDDAEVNEAVDINDNTTPKDFQQEQIEESEIEKIKKEGELYKDKYLRLFAEFDNYKRRNAKERIELMQTAGKEVITSLLDVLDDVDRAEKQINRSTDIEQLIEGVQLVFNKLRTTLQSKGLKAMESLNTDFDVEKHEAITEIEIPDKSKKGKVVDDVVKGYYLNDKLIRFAKVVVGK